MKDFLLQQIQEVTLRIKRILENFFNMKWQMELYEMQAMLVFYYRHVFFL